MNESKTTGLPELGLNELDSLFAEETTRFETVGQGKAPDLGFFRNIPVKVTLEVASTELPLGNLMQVADGAVIGLDKRAGEPLDVRVNGQLLARGELVVVDGKYGVRLLEVVDGRALSGQEG